ncbi:MAG: hypothetical protein QM739_05710 [Propionivibrio sp.]
MSTSRLPENGVVGAGFLGRGQDFPPLASAISAADSGFDCTPRPSAKQTPGTTHALAAVRRFVKYCGIAERIHPTWENAPFPKTRRKIQARLGKETGREKWRMI